MLLFIYAFDRPRDVSDLIFEFTEAQTEPRKCGQRQCRIKCGQRKCRLGCGINTTPTTVPPTGRKIEYFIFFVHLSEPNRCFFECVIVNLLNVIFCQILL